VPRRGEHQPRTRHGADPPRTATLPPSAASSPPLPTPTHPLPIPSPSPPPLGGFLARSRSPDRFASRLARCLSASVLAREQRARAISSGSRPKRSRVSRDGPRRDRVCFCEDWTFRKLVFSRQSEFTGARRDHYSFQPAREILLLSLSFVIIARRAHTEREREREREREAQRFIYSLRLFLNAICTETVTNIYSDNNNKRGEIKPATRVITLGEIIAIKTKSRASRRRRRRIFFAITNNNTIRDRFPLLFFSLFFSFFLFFLFFFFPPFRAGRFVSLAPEVIAGVGVEGSIRGCLANRRINKTAECHRPAEEEKKKWISIHGAPRCVRTDER